MKKFLAVLLATVMMFTVCAMSVFADMNLSTDSRNDYSGSRYFIDDSLITAEGFIEFYSGTRYLSYGVNFRNNDYNEIETFMLHAQCAVNYSDDTQDFYRSTRYQLVPLNAGDQLQDSATTASGKTIIYFDGEFQVSYDSENLWEGFIGYSCNTLGINA